MLLEGYSIGCPDFFLDSAVLCMVDSVPDTSKKYGVSFAKELASEEKGGF